MSKIWIVAPLLVVLSGGAALAQDSPAVPDFDWTGLYLGVQGGYQAGETRVTEFFSATGLPTGYTPHADMDGFTGGGHIGYVYQTGAAVLGVEADAELTNITGRHTTASSIFETTQQWQASLRVRLGVTAADRLLIYATGGLAVTGFDNAANYLPGPFAKEWNGIAAGGTIGLGAEYAISDHLSLRGEYRYSDFGRFDFDWFNIGGTGINASYEQTLKTHSVRAGLSYRF
ncbi:outer membrane protein [Devosia sp. Root436]|uniref:outer membrane protein n=1 Tax=Devosia sp. Root436 TaxID=1736537 RepID=UPI000AE88E0F|nr:outer membrane protein [Devosia sp. Root436]